MKNRLEAYRQGRDNLLARVATELSNDERFCAAWLMGSYAKNEADIEREIERRTKGLPRKYIRGSLSQFRSTREKQIECIGQLCSRMQKLAPEVTQFSGVISAIPLTEVETLLSLLDE